jgi:hypothetical protein
VQGQRQRAYDLGQEADQYGRLADAINQSVSDTVERLRVSFIKRVQQFLPESDEFSLTLSEGEREVARFGFVRNGRLHTALSGAEWARLTLALAAATVDRKCLNIITPEDRAFDPATLTQVLLALSTSPEQIIICSAVEPLTIPAEWTVIRTDKAAPVVSGDSRWGADVADYPTVIGAFCSVCKNEVKSTPSGTICFDGHGGADLVDAAGAPFAGAIPKARRKRKSAP